MPLPDPHADEPTQEVDHDTWKLYQEAKAAVQSWTIEMVRLKRKLLEEMGDAYAATVDGQKVVTYRPKDQYAEARLREDYPDLTAHFVEHRMEAIFNMEAFRKRHPEIAEKYRVRSFNEVKGV